ncbi:MAG TPA: alpha-amylase family protein [Mycobacteriales bacterium]|nr:alpha-amylase family protein [Mycobacteriales bacterium]
MPDWERHAIWWQVYPLGFTGADEHPAHRLTRISGWLDYAVDLGVSGLAFGPIFAASTHGYDTVDHFRIDPRLGDLEDFRSLLAAAHERGLKVLLDGAFNHVGRDHPAFRQVLELGPDAPQAGWFRLRWRSAAEPEYDTFEGHRELVALNHDNPAVADHVSAVLAYWLQIGVDGWRLDAAYAVPPPFWARVLPRVRAAFPQLYAFGEVIHGDYADIVRASTMDSVTQYELWKAIWSSLNDRNFFELAWALQRHNGFLEHFVPLTFLGNHDVTRLASRLEDARFLEHALVLLMTLGGTPTVYYGDEQAFAGIKEDRAGGDDVIRPAFPDAPAGLAPYGWWYYRLHQQLIGLRRRHGWLHAARTEQLHLTNTGIAYAATAAGERLVVALNLAPAPLAVPAPEVSDVLAGAASLQDGDLNVRPYGWAILR